MCSNYPEIKLEPALGTSEDKIEHLSSYARVVHTPAKLVISRRRKNENVYKMSKNEKCTCKACKNTVFRCQICKFVRLLLPSSFAQAPQLRALATKKATPRRTPPEKKKNIFGNCNYSAIIPCIPFQLRDVDEVLLSLTAISAVEVKTEN